MLSEGRKLMDRFLNKIFLELTDIQSVSLGDVKYYQEMRNAFASRLPISMENKKGITTEDAMSWMKQIMGEANGRQ
jgi:hypothetical protein